MVPFFVHCDHAKSKATDDPVQCLECLQDTRFWPKVAPIDHSVRACMYAEDGSPRILKDGPKSTVRTFASCVRLLSFHRRWHSLWCRDGRRSDFQRCHFVSTVVELKDLACTVAKGLLCLQQEICVRHQGHSPLMDVPKRPHLTRTLRFVLSILMTLPRAVQLKDALLCGKMARRWRPNSRWKESRSSPSPPRRTAGDSMPSAKKAQRIKKLNRFARPVT